jgi:hypothetical protein
MIMGMTGQADRDEFQYGIGFAVGRAALLLGNSIGIASNVRKISSLLCPRLTGLKVSA